MEVVIIEKKRETLESFADRHDLTMEVNERSAGTVAIPWNPSFRYYAAFRRCEVKKGAFLCGEFGNGETPDAAIASYAKRISEQVLVLNAYGPDRREFIVPILTYEKSAG